VVDGWLAGVGDECELEPGGALEDGALGAGELAAGELAAGVEVVKPRLVELVVEPLAVVVPPVVVAARGVAPVPVAR
jgi:hypothetical protein